MKIICKLELLMIMLIIFLAGFVLKNTYYPKSYMIEGFESKNTSEKYKYHTKVTDIFDDFYCNIYDDLMLDSKKINYEIQKILELMIGPLERNNDVLALDVGSGPGHHVRAMNQNGIRCMGIDISSSMIKLAQKNYPDNAKTFIHGDALNTMRFQPGSFQLITCLYYTIYYLKDKQRFLSNCAQWLRPGGYLVIHVVNRKKFSPIVNASDPLLIISPQKYSKERITESVAEFNNFSYKANFNYEESSQTGNFSEIFKFKNKNKGLVRQNEHKIQMIGIKKLTSMAEDLGFFLEKTISLGKCGYEYQYLLVLKRVN